MRDARGVERDPIGPAGLRSDAPDIRVAKLVLEHFTLDEIDERAIGRPRLEMRVSAFLDLEEWPILRLLSGRSDERRIARSGRVVDELRGIGGPVEFGGAFE